MMRVPVSLLLIVVALSSGAVEKFVLADRTKKVARTIVLPVEPTVTETYAASELRDFTEKLTGVRPEIQTNGAAAKAVVIARGDAKQLGEDGFTLKVEKGSLYVRGGSVAGSLYGVYELLERFGGCRWYSSWHSVVPELKVLAVPANLNETQKPTFAVREIYNWDYIHARRPFAARSRQNGHWLMGQRRDLGARSLFGGGLDLCHTVWNVFPRGLFKDHPEWFALIGKDRKDFQPCWTDPHVIAISVTNFRARVTAAIAEAKEKGVPKPRYYGVSQWDAAPQCECERCAALNEAEGTRGTAPLTVYVNALADELAKLDPDAFVQTLNYQRTYMPCAKLRYRPNVMPCVCNIWCDFSRAFTDDNPPDTDPNYIHHGENANFVRHMRAWGEQSKGRDLQIWDYVTSFRNYPCIFRNLDCLAKDIRFYRDCGVTYMFMQSCTASPHSEFSELKCYLMSKLLWNAAADEKKIEAEFIDGFYGPAAPFVRQYLKELYALPRKSRWVGIYQGPGVDVPADFLVDCEKLWERAEAAVRGADPVYAYNLRMCAMLSARLTLFEQYVDAKGQVGSAAQEWMETNGPALAKWLLDRIADAKTGYDGAWEGGDIRISNFAPRSRDMLKELKAMAEQTAAEAEADKIEIEVIAHRGDHDASVPENTLEAIQRAYAAGASCVETDLHMNRAMEDIVIVHDFKRLRELTKNPKCNDIFLLSEKQVRELNVGASSGTAKPYHMPLVGEVLKAVPHDRTIQLELKYCEGDFNEILADAIKAAGLGPQNIRISSMNFGPLRRWKKEHPDYKAEYLAFLKQPFSERDLNELIKQCKANSVDIVCPAYESVRDDSRFPAAFADKIRAAGLGFAVFGVNADWAFKRLVELKAQAFTSDKWRDAGKWAWDYKNVKLKGTVK